MHRSEIRMRSVERMSVRVERLATGRAGTTVATALAGIVRIVLLAAGWAVTTVAAALHHFRRMEVLNQTVGSYLVRGVAATHAVQRYGMTLYVGRVFLTIWKGRMNNRNRITIFALTA